MTDGHKSLHVLTPLQKAYETGGKEIIRTFEKNVTLLVIDDAWKEHLRELDELRHSVQNAVYEQKDPLLIYKLESFKLFEGLLGRINREILSMLYKGHIEQHQDEPTPVEQARPQRPLPASKPLKTSREDLYSGPSASASVSQFESQQNQPKPEPVRVERTVGRNDPCPCGSGKKFKNCHGKEE
jgi:preprotein translocase subunit SecA